MANRSANHGSIKRRSASFRAKRLRNPLISDFGWIYNYFVCVMRLKNTVNPSVFSAIPRSDKVGYFPFLFLPFPLFFYLFSIFFSLLISPLERDEDDGSLERKERRRHRKKERKKVISEGARGNNLRGKGVDGKNSNENRDKIQQQKKKKT